LPWKINHEKCFTYWCKAGTDCGRCVTVCPYSHPNNFIHNIIRLGIKRNSANRWLALKLDDYFYRRKPEIKPVNNWSVLGKS
jgi:ferredoxin